MRRCTRHASIVAIVVLAGACSGPSLTNDGFISLGRDNGEGVGAAPATGGFGGTDASTGDDAGTAGTIFPQGGTEGGANGGTSTGANGGTSTGANGGTSTGAEGGEGTGGTTTGANGGTAGNSYGGTAGNSYGGTAGDANGGTSTGGDGNTCGSGGLPEDPGGFEACERVGRVGRICTPDGRVYYCGERMSTFIEQCEPGTCATGCCHATSDPCQHPMLNEFDCVGDCGGGGSCSEAPILNLTLGGGSLELVRVGGSNTAQMPCGAGTRRYFELFLSGPATRITVSAPWMILGSLTCADAPDALCAVSPAGDRVVFVATDADPPPARNIVVETHGYDPTCPEF